MTGAIETLYDMTIADREHMGAEQRVFHVPQQSKLDRNLDAARRSLGDAESAKARSEGRAMTVNEAVEHAFALGAR